MGTLLTLEVEGASRAAALAASEAALAEVGRIERLLSTWDGATPLSALNRAPAGVPVQADPELVALLSSVEAWAAATGRAFEPAVGPLLDAWGVRTGGRTPTAPERARAMEAVRAGFTVDRGSGTVTRNHPGARIDAGAFGKGAALDAAAEALHGAGVPRALLDFGGQIRTVGAPGAPAAAGAEGAWSVALAHPARRGRSVGTLRVGPGLSVATSGSSERPGHLLDPRTGRPAPAWGSVTVVAPSALAADALATGLYVLGPEGAIRWGSERDDVGVLVLEATGGRSPAARWTPAMERWIESIDGGRAATTIDERNQP